MQIEVIILANTKLAAKTLIEFTIEDDEVCWSVAGVEPSVAKDCEEFIRNTGEESVVINACKQALKEID